MGDQTQQPTEPDPLEAILAPKEEEQEEKPALEEAQGEGVPEEEKAEADEESPGDLTPEQLEALSRDERVRRKVLAEETGGRTIDQLIEQILAEKAEAEKAAKVAEEQQKTLLEAVQKAEDPESPDYEELGRIAYQMIRRQREVAPIVEAVSAQKMREFLAAMDDATEALGLQDAAAALTAEERQEMARLLGQGDLRRFTAEAFRRLREKDAALKQQRGLENNVRAAARTAERARSGPAGLPPGKPAEASPAEVDIVAYLRERM